MKRFWEFRNEAGKSELYLYGEIADGLFWGDEVTPKAFKADLDQCHGALDVYINSGGGEVFAGMAIYNMLKRYDGHVTVHIDGLAASIASVIAMAGDEIVMPANALMMIHDAWTVVAGNAADLTATAEELRRMDGLIRDIYAARTGLEGDRIEAWMDEETWFTAQEALDAGMIDAVEANKAMAASLTGETLTLGGEQIQLARYRHADKLRGMVERVQIVYGPPCSGKSTYVREHAGAEDLIYDYDALVAAMVCQDKRGAAKTVAHDIAVQVRDVLIEHISGESAAKGAWIITTWPSDALREQLEGLNADELRMDTPREECVRRLEADETRTDKDEWRAAIDRWFAEHEPDDGAEGQPVEDSSTRALEEQRDRFRALRRRILETTSD